MIVIIIIIKIRLLFYTILLQKLQLIGAQSMFLSKKRSQLKNPGHKRDQAARDALLNGNVFN